VNYKLDLHERACFDLAQIDGDASSLPAADGDVKVTFQTNNCDGQPSTSGSYMFESQGVGFICDNPKHPDDLDDVTCDNCFDANKCAKNTWAQHFPVKRSKRVVKAAFKSTSKFVANLGIKCEKGSGGVCNRNFEFSASFNACKDKDE